MKDSIRQLWDHLAWADGLMLDALDQLAEPPADVVREYAHILGVDEVWLARLEQRTPTTAIWPPLEAGALRRLAGQVHQAWTRYLDGIDEAGMAREVAYTNSIGQSFRNPVQDILLHVTLHAQYHRGKVNLLLRQRGLEPVPTDYISFIRGVAAARTSPR